jgi:type 1 glutamine amidotransferase
MRIFIPLILCITALAATLVQPKKDARRLEVLFFGAPTAAHPGHDPITRYRVIKRNLGTEGINFTYSEDPAVVFNAKTLEHFDAVMMYGNWQQNGPMPAEQLKALTDYVESGHGFLPLHCASACYGGSPEFIKLVGGRFKSHTDGVFEPKNTSAKHPIIDGFKSFSAWDETYVHDNHGDDRVILQTREQEPWTWVRNQGKGRVFYTASGHDHRVWDLPQFQELLKRAVYWSVGPEAYGKLKALDLPKLEMEKVELPGYLKRQVITEAQKPLSPEDSMKLRALAFRERARHYQSDCSFLGCERSLLCDPNYRLSKRSS